MIFQITSYVIPIFLIAFFILLVLSRALFLKNWKTKKINIVETENVDLHKQRLFELIQIDTPSFTDGEGYRQFKEKIEEQFPLIHKFFKKEKLDGNAIYTYDSPVENAPNLLFATHIDYTGEERKAYIDEDFIYGNGTFDSKSLLYVIFEAVERVLDKDGMLDVDLTLVVTNDDEANKEGLLKIIDLFLRRGKFFNLVIEEGSGIIDPEVYGMKSNYALVGLGVSGQTILRFESSNKTNLARFVTEVTNPRFFKMKIDNKSIRVLGSIAKDLNFKDRFFLNNIFLFKRKARNIIENKYDEIEKMLKTNVSATPIVNENGKYYVDMTFELSTHEKAADILVHLDDVMEKHKIDYKILSVTDNSRITRTYTYGYKLIKNAINHTFKNLYIAPVIVTKIAEKRYFDKVSDCVIRFSPLYYNYDAFNAAKENKSYIDAKVLNYGVEFFQYILKNYNQKRKTLN